MNPIVYTPLLDLHARWGPQEFGKIAQKFLAIAFRYAGYQRIVERGVQGVDVDAAGDGLVAYTTEVKTTTSLEVLFAAKDVEGLNDRAAEGYTTVLACLFLRSVLCNWIFTDAGALRVGQLKEDQLRPGRFRQLEALIIPQFDRAVTNHFPGAMRSSQGYLDDVLRNLKITIGDQGRS